MSDVLVIDDCDDAILGHVFVENQLVVVYDYEKLIEVFMGQDMDREGAVDWVEFNIVGAHLGAGTPLILYTGDRAMIDELAQVYD